MSRNRLSDRHTELRVENSTHEFLNRFPNQKSNIEWKIDFQIENRIDKSINRFLSRKPTGESKNKIEDD